MKKKILLMTVALLCAVVQSTWADEGTWMDKGIRAEAFSSIDEDNKTISITNAAELGLLAYNISYDTEGHGYKDYTITLTKNLDMSAHKWGGWGTFKGTIKGCYSAAKIIKSDDASYQYVGGIAGWTGGYTGGLPGAPIVTMNVSQVVIDQGTYNSDKEHRGYVIGDPDHVVASHNYYLANETSNHGMT